MRKNFEIDMTTGNILKKMIFFAIPLMLTGALQLFYNAADVVVVGKYAGVQALSAVGSTGALINLIIGVFMGISVGVSVVVSRFFGASDFENLDEVTHTAIISAGVIGVVLVFIGFTLSNHLLVLMNTPENVIDLSTLYMRIFFLGVPFNLIYNFGAAILRAIGDTRRPLIFLTFSGLINVVLNFILVVFFDMSVAGVAIATITSQFISAILVVRALFKNQGKVRLSMDKFKFSKDKFKLLVKVGLPAGIQGSLFSLSNVAIQSSINIFGDVVMAGNTAASSIESFLYTCTANAFQQTNINFVSQNYGAGQFKRVRKCLWYCLILSVGLSLFLASVFRFFGTELLSLYNTDSAVIEIGLKRMSYLFRFYFLFASMDVLVGFMRGVGNSILPMVVSLCGICLFRIAWISVVFTQNQFIETLYISYPISWALTFTAQAICCYIIYKKIPKNNLLRN